jgi:hypothetical protein
MLPDMLILLSVQKEIILYIQFFLTAYIFVDIFYELVINKY